MLDIAEFRELPLIPPFSPLTKDRLKMALNERAGVLEIPFGVGFGGSEARKRFVAGLVPVQGFPQAAVARGSAQGSKRTEQLVGEIVVASGVAQWVLSGVDQRIKQFWRLSMPEGLRAGQGWSEVG
jgi:hypothetical protein